MFSQPQKFAIRNSNPVLFQLSLSKFYTNSISSPSSPQNDSNSSFHLNKFAKTTAKQLPTVIIGKLVVVSIISLILVDFFYAGYQNWYNEHLLNKTVEKGTQFKIDVLNDKFIPRPLVIDRLKKIFQPNRNQSYYHVVYGECENIDDFGIVFGKSLNFAFEKHISFTAQLIKKILGDTNSKDERPKWKKALEAFKRAVFDTLQDDAKMNADGQKYIAVFINSEDWVSKRMESRSSSWSRVDKPVMEISDLSKEESIKYLVEKRKINKKEAKKLYELVGGRIVELKSVADKFLAEQTFEVIEQQILTEVKKKFNSAKLLQDQIYHEAGKDVIHALLNFKEIDINLFKKYFKDESVNEILKANVFAYHPSRDTVTFQSQSVGE
ncbi:unnamed protein product [Rhizophagus irregularis]|nr:unnamed protein product [Rhizophagus irregularis]